MRLRRKTRPLLEKGTIETRGAHVKEAEKWRAGLRVRKCLDCEARDVLLEK